MPIYEGDKYTYEKLSALRKRNVCAVCGERLDLFANFGGGGGLAFLACTDWLRTHHEGIERESSRWEKEGMASLNIETRREIMEQQHGTAMTTAMEKARIPTTGALTQPQAMTILKLVYPDIPEPEIVRTAILCRDFGLHPLMKEVYIIGFKNNRTGKTEYSTVIGISANRKMAAARKGAYSFLDDTPGAATPEQIIQQFGKNSDEERGNLISFCKLKGEKGNIATGFGLWPNDKVPKGIEKGNSKRNMANIRAERQALDRLPGDAIPFRELEVVDEAYVEVPDVGKVDTATGEITEGEFTELGNGDEPIALPQPTPKEHEHWCAKHHCAFEEKPGKYPPYEPFWAHATPKCPEYPKGWCTEKKGKDKPPAAKAKADAPPPEPEQKPLPEQEGQEITASGVGKVEDIFNESPKEPEPGTFASLKLTMDECNWSGPDVKEFCNTERGWNIANPGDLGLEQITEIVSHIKHNPK